MKVLLAQPYGDNGTLKHDSIYKEIQLFINETKEQIDLIVFPEAFEFAEIIEEQGLDIVMKVAQFFDIWGYQELAGQKKRIILTHMLNQKI